MTNLAPNPSFEEDEPILNDATWTNWCTWNDTAGAATTIKLDDTEAVDGLRSLRVDPKGGTDWYFIVALISMPGKVGTKYTASFWAKAEKPRPTRQGSAKRLTAKGFGPDRPIASNDTDDGKQQNRRIEFLRLR